MSSLASRPHYLEALCFPEQKLNNTFALDQPCPPLQEKHPGLRRARVPWEPRRVKKQMPVLKHHQLELPCSLCGLGRAPAVWRLPLELGSFPQVPSLMPSE
ncbi:hypothetical protein H1C71_014738 [Ictidomys tridecemlineatus]|nr:hypothetical protein H1C71_014738 [Ictidomys tridecemlineatus]